jgi:hypothetical protein
MKSGIYPLNPEIILSTLDPPSIGIPLEENNSSLLEEVPRILRERSRDKTPPIIPFKDLVEEVISRGVLSLRSRAFIRELLIFAEERNTEATLLRREHARRTHYSTRVRRVRRVSALQLRAGLSFQGTLYLGRSKKQKKR